jgi:hypothetical protein
MTEGRLPGSSTSSGESPLFTVQVHRDGWNRVMLGPEEAPLAVLVRAASELLEEAARQATAGPLTADAARIRTAAAWTQRAAMALEAHTAMRSAGEEDPPMRDFDPEGYAVSEWKTEARD